MEEKEKKQIKVINGDGSNLEISPAYDYLNISTPISDDDKPKNIVIPQVKHKKDENNSKSDDTKEDSTKSNNNDSDSNEDSNDSKKKE